MATQNPTGGKRSVPLDLRPSHVAFVRFNLTSCLDAVKADLETPERMRNPDRAGREAAACERLLAGLGRGQVVVPDEEARCMVARLLAGADDGNEYAQAVAEHDALDGLLAKLTMPSGCSDE